MPYSTLCMISLPELGVIVWVAVLLFGCKAVSQNPMLTRGQRILWIGTIVILSWIGLLWYYYVFYMKNDDNK